MILFFLYNIFLITLTLIILQPNIYKDMGPAVPEKETRRENKLSKEKTALYNNGW